jgi:hypothetical protein
MFAISADYKKDDIDPFSTTSVDYAYTDSDGYISFPDMRYTVYGFAGTYKMLYACDGMIIKSSVTTTVTTTVA